MKGVGAADGWGRSDCRTRKAESLLYLLNRIRLRQARVGCDLLLLRVVALVAPLGQ